MKTPRHSRESRIGFALIGFVLALPSCSEELRGEPAKTVRVSGKVVEGTQPLRGGWIEFIPLDGTVGDLRSAPIGRDGTFSVDGVGVGTNGIGLVDIPSRLPNGGRIFDTLGTPIRRQIGPSGESSLTLDLVDEAIKFQSSFNRPR